VTTTLLAVDDSKTMRRVLEITFAGDIYKVATAENADEALNKAQAERPSVALLDAGLEGTNGYELCQRLKAAQPGLLVVILSSKHQPYDRNRGSQVGADDFMDKPFDTQQLLDKVSALSKKAASAPMAAPPPQPQQPDASARLRAQTLSYASGAAPVSPAAPPVAAAPAPRPPAPVMPAAAARPAVPATRQQTMIGTPLPAEVAPAVRAPVAVPGLAAPAPVPVAAPAPVAAVAPAVAALTSNGSELAQKLGGLGLSRDQADAVLALSREVVERVVWEVVPTLAEALIKEEIRRLTSE